MWWLIGGIAIGAIAGGATGAMAGAVLGGGVWLIAYGMRLRESDLREPRRRATRNAAAPALADRVDAMEQRLARLEAELAALRGPRASDAPAPSSSAVETTTLAPARPHLPEPAALASTAARANGAPNDTGAAPEPVVAAVAPALPPAAHRAELAAVLERAETAALGAPSPQRPSEVVLRSASSASSPQPPRSPASTAAPSAWWERLASGNIVAKAGTVVLFFGIAFLLKYAYDRAVFPPEARLLGVAAAGLAMVALGWKLLATRRLYGLILQGGGLGVLYLDVFFALRWFGVFSPGIAFTLFAFLGAGTVVLAAARDARPLAVLGLLGAFAAPPLASTGGGSHIALFSYYLLLNLAVLAISWYRSWRELNLVGFVFTFVIGGIWGARYYRPEYFGSVEPFLLASFAIYVAIPILFARRQPPELKGVVDATLVFGTPLFVAVAQAALVRHMPYGLAWSAAGGAALYAALATATFRADGLRLLAESYVVLATVLTTLAVFFAFDAYPTFALWTLQGCAILWIGLRQWRWGAQAFGLGLQIVAALYFLGNWTYGAPAHPLWNDFVLGCAIVAAASLASGWLLHRHGAHAASPFAGADGALVLWALVWWFGGALYAFDHALTAQRAIAAAIAFATATFALLELGGRRLAWPAPRKATALHVAALAVGAFALTHSAGDGPLPPPLAQYGWVAWPLAFAVLFWCLHRQRRDGLALLDAPRAYAAWALMLGLASWVGAWLIADGRFGPAMAWGGGGVALAWLRWRLRERTLAEARSFSGLVIAWALAWWLAGGTGLAFRESPYGWDTAVLLAFFAATAIAFELLGARLAWPAARRAALVLPLGMALATGLFVVSRVHPAVDGGAIGWPVAFAALYALLHRQGRAEAAALPAAQHLFGAWLAVGLLTWEAVWQAAEHGLGGGWRAAAWLVPGALALATASGLARAGRWPVAVHRTAYVVALATPLAAAGLLWSIAASPLDAGSADPLRYLPVLNPLDLAQALVFVALWLFARWVAAEPAPEITRATPLVLGAAAFVWLNAMLLRTVHHWAGVPFALDALFDSVLTQAALSLVWTTTALALMLAATRRGLRAPWVAGAVLLAIVVLKLFVNDLGGTGTIARIVSFIGVGILLLAIGYLAPVPPARAEQRGD